MVDAQKLIDTLQNAGYGPRGYSGRGMFGKICVGVSLESESELWTMAQELIDIDGLHAPHTDSLGRGIIAYWPRVAWPT
jgi:hypothetical protein